MSCPFMMSGGEKQKDLGLTMREKEKDGLYSLGIGCF
jgi:hypothetical protein